ncbi:response regulator [Synechocystis sp. LKSZ1]|uniref:hybrid sensor histidine kinase/response regulator n=1 Tax=Synechocystis sp. LKSZ1 TaxID=3144951 RepID=UPI00336BE69B
MSTTPKPKVLIVDDSPDNLQMLMEILKTDYAVVVATTGEKALQLARKIPPPDLIILDVIMPGMDGYEVCTQLKQDFQTQAIPVIFVTALGEAGHESKGFELGAVDYIIKPFSPPVVKARLKSHLTMQQLYNELQQTNQELSRATHLKDEFLANMSHELRTPLNAILGMTEGLQEGIFGLINEKQLKALRTVESSANHLLSLINDILDVAKIEAGKITLDYGSTSIESLCQSALTFIKQPALKKNIQLQTDIPSDLSDIWADEIRLRQVLLNLLTNAVKFTPEGGTVTLALSVLPPEKNEPAYLRFAITDTGIGIAPENMVKLFKPFVQIDSALNRQYNGTGLGLALVKQIVELHGGHVGLVSELGAGSCFTVDLPYEPKPDSSPHAQDFSYANGTGRVIPETSPSLRPSAALILLVEDEPANVITISSYLEVKGYRLLCANDGREAIELALAHHPHLILMDIQMPGMDGLEAIRQIRQQEALQETPIIALTALAAEGDRERCLAAGADEYLSKPVRLKQLEKTIQAWLAHGHS